jgi:beta-glucosidase
MKPFSLPKGFLLGSATAAAQIEGGDKGNNWYAWCVNGKIKDKSSILRANDHWNRYEEDVNLLKILNNKIYRMGIDWSRIEPLKGQFDAVAISHYRDELKMLVGMGIKPLVTLHHFTHPLWLCEEGEFETTKVVEYYERYVRYVVENIGDLVSDYITINEPNVFVSNGYIYGSWPPGKTDLKLAIKVYFNMSLCHIAAYKAIHEIRKDKGFEKLSGETKVGFADHMRVFTPFNKLNPLDWIAKKIATYIFEDAIAQLMAKGHLKFPLSLFTPAKRGHYYEFIGINYYTRSAVRLIGFKDGVVPGTKVNDLGWEIYPKGMSYLCKRYYRKYKAPIWITENGVCDNNDTYRSKFIYDHLLEISKVCEEGVPVERYYHWSLLDNFEWLEGESARFGLVHVDYETQQRTIKKSGYFYAELCENNGVTQEMIDKYL